MTSLSARVQRPQELWGNLRAALGDLVAQEFTPSIGHLTAFLSGCLFAPSILTFWFVNGVLDFSSAVVLGAIASPAGLQLRLFAYLLLVPTFLFLRAAIHLAHPTHRRQVLAGSCPRTTFLSLDWFSAGILATGLPLSLRHLGPWLAMNLLLVAGLLLVPRAAPGRAARSSKLAAIVLGPAVFVYARYGGTLALLPDPATTLGPVATLTLSPATTDLLLRTVNSLVVGPVLVGAFGIVMNRLLTHPEVRTIPVIQHTLPDRDPDRVVAASAAMGTVFYLLVVAAATGSLTIVP